MLLMPFLQNRNVHFVKDSFSVHLSALVLLACVFFFVDIFFVLSVCCWLESRNDIFLSPFTIIIMISSIMALLTLVARVSRVHFNLSISVSASSFTFSLLFPLWRCHFFGAVHLVILALLCLLSFPPSVLPFLLFTECSFL